MSAIERLQDKYEELKKTNQELLEALVGVKENSYSIFPEGIFVSEDAYSEMCKAITNAKQAGGDSDE